jgi:hypothetical protein
MADRLTDEDPMSTAHYTSIEYEPPSKRHGGVLVLHGGHRGRCTCGWWSDCYSQMSDTQRAIEVHLRRAKRVDIDALIERSSIGAGIADIKKRGIHAHLVDLEREMRLLRRSRARKAKRAARLKPEDVAFMRGFGVALASIWRCQHDGQMVRMLIKENGFTIDAFRGVDLLDADFEAIQQAVDQRMSVRKT